ncbi:MAG TPA: TIR domain-containing protein [Candidatus Kapabacteria bacterium]|nr:TIR domain-containing protein [Candidatus Kapabacteria bacterium]
MTTDVFISYSRDDKDRVLALANELRAAGISLWIDQGGIDAATMWSEEIVNAIENAKVLMLMVSENAVASTNVVKEVVLASERKGHILPVHLEPTRIPQGLKYPLAGIQHVEYFQGDPKENLKSILRALERLGIEAKPQPSKVVAGGVMPATASHTMHSSHVELERAIAVLPFSNMSPDKETDYFSDGLTEELITSLSRLKDIRVVPGTATMSYKGTQKSIGAIGEELRARFVITGSVRKHLDNVRIAAQLIDAQTEAQLWAETYKGKLEDIFEIQENVAKQIVEALSIKLTMVQEIALTKRSTDNAEALDYYMRGREFRYKANRKNFQFAIELFKKAIELDTRYANAYAGMSEVYSMLFEFERKPEHLSKSAEASLKALMYDPSSAEAYAALGLTHYYQGNPEEAEAACHKAIELDPQLFVGYRNLGRIYHLTDRDENAAEMLQKATELKPEDYATIGVLSGIYTRLGHRDDQKKCERLILELMPRYLLRNPEDTHARIFYAIALAGAGRTAEAKQEATIVLEASFDDSNSLYNVACCLAQLHDSAAAVDALRKAIAVGYANYDWIKRDSDLDPIRNHPGYIELMKDK